MALTVIASTIGNATEMSSLHDLLQTDLVRVESSKSVSSSTSAVSDALVRVQSQQSLDVDLNKVNASWLTGDHYFG